MIDEIFVNTNQLIVLNEVIVNRGAFTKISLERNLFFSVSVSLKN